MSRLVQGMEVYSTVLWHLKRETALSNLAQEAVGWDRRSPHAWAIMGNCFSLQKVPHSLSVHLRLSLSTPTSACSRVDASWAQHAMAMNAHCLKPCKRPRMHAAAVQRLQQ